MTEVAGVLVALIGAASLVATLTDDTAAIGAYGIGMPAQTALSLLLCGAAIGLIDAGGEPSGRPLHRFGQCAAALALAVSSVTVLMVFSRYGAAFSFPGAAAAGSVPSNSAVAVWLAAVALLALGSRRGGPARAMMVGISGTLIFAIGAFGLIHPPSEFSVLTGSWKLAGVPVPAAVAFMVLGAGLLWGTWQLAGVRWAIDLRLSAGLMAGVALILAISLAAYRRTADLVDTSVAVAQSQGVRTRLAEVLAGLAQAETGARGYLITSDEAYLDPYSRGSASVAERLAVLRQSVTDDADQQARAEQLERAATRELQLLRQMVGLARVSGPPGSPLRALMAQDNSAMAEISRLVADMDRDELETLQSRERQNQAAAEETALLVPLWATACIVILGLVFLALNRGIADRLRAEAELHRRNLELAEASRAKDRFLARMSHEFRTPLNAILGFTGTLLMNMHGRISPPQEKALRTIRENGARLLEMIEQILDVIRLDTGRVEVCAGPVDCATLIGQVGDTARRAAAVKGLELAVDPSAGPLPAVSDARLLRRILDELVGNAVKFTDHGRVRLAASRCHHGSDGGEEIGWTEFVIEDTGIGIRDEDQARLFAAFSQVEESNLRLAVGAGLGLYLSGRLATLIGGRIRVHSELGKGSTFTLEVPDMAAASPAGTG